MCAASCPPTELPQALGRICAGLEGVAPADWTYEVVSETAMPAPFQTLLVHREHMTATLRDYYATDMALRVLQERTADGWYRRLITLSLAESGEIVELSVVAMHLTRLPIAVQETIRARRRPLGDILIGSTVRREIVPQWYLRFGGIPGNFLPWGVSIDHDVFGRIGVIHCDGHPAIELLEIVTGFTLGPQRAGARFV